MITSAAFAVAVLLNFFALAVARMLGASPSCRAADAHVLRALAEGERNGYEIMRVVRDRTGAEVVLGPSKSGC